MKNSSFILGLIITFGLSQNAFADCSNGFPASAPLDPATAAPLTTANLVAKVAVGSDDIPDGSRTYSCIDKNGRDHEVVLTKHSHELSMVVDNHGPYVQPSCYTVYDPSCPRSKDPTPQSMDPFDAYEHFHVDTASQKDILAFIDGQDHLLQIIFPLSDGSELGTRGCTTDLSTINTSF